MTLAAMVDVLCDRSWGRKKENCYEIEEKNACKETSITTAETQGSIKAKYNAGKSIPNLIRDSMISAS